MTRGIFVGLSTIDIVYSVDEFPAPNAKVAARSQSVLVGGPATNAAIAFAHLGGQATLLTAVGRHPLAQVIRQELQQHSVQLIDLNPDFDNLPVLSSVTVNRNGDRNIVSANAARVMAPLDQVDRKLLEQASIVLVDGHFMQACQAWASAARASGTPVVFDGGSWKTGTEELLHSVHTAICSADFLPPGCSNKDEVFRYLKNRGVSNAAITAGPAPVRFVAGDVSGIVPVPQVAVADTLGAGDIFHGAYCFFAARGTGFVEALAEAAKIAAESCRFAGTKEWMKD